MSLPTHIWQVSATEAHDYLQYHAVADADGDGKIDLRELVRYLKPLDEANQRAAQENARMATEDALTAHFVKNVARHETRIANACSDQCTRRLAETAARLAPVRKF